MTAKGHQKGKYANESAQFVLSQTRKSKAQRNNEVKERIAELTVQMPVQFDTQKDYLWK